MKSPRRLLALLLVALPALVLGACGNRHEGPITEGETEAVYVELGGLKYQVQISRQLNPFDVEDRAYFVGVPEDRRRLPGDETWFGVFLRVENGEEEELQPAGSFHIVDTAENEYRPLALPQDNVFRYEPRQLPPDGQLPEQNSAAANGPIQGSLLLFRMTNESLGNRPLEFVIEQPFGAGEAKVTLDV